MSLGVSRRDSQGPLEATDVDRELRAYWSLSGNTVEDVDARPWRASWGLLGVPWGPRGDFVGARRGGRALRYPQLGLLGRLGSFLGLILGSSLPSLVVLAVRKGEFWQSGAVFGRS